MNIAKRVIKSDREALYKHSIYAAFLIITSAFLIWKCRYGFGNVDESFYITIPYRLFKGDALFLHEWHLSQMAGLLTYPIVSLYMSIKGSTVGIVLFMRYVCTVLQIITAVFIYIRLNKINWLGAFLASISYLLYIPFGIMALSYNSIAIMALIICAVIIFTAQSRLKIQYVIAGLFYAAAVLCCPYLAFVFVIYVAVVVVSRLISKLKKKTKEPDFYFYTVKGTLFLSIGAAIAALAFLIFVCSRASISEIIKAFPLIFDDPEHPPISFIKLIKNFVSYIIESNRVSLYIYPILIALAGICLADKRRVERKNGYLFIVLICVLILVLGYYNINAYINHIMWSLNVLAFFIVIITNEKIIKNIFYSTWVLGIVYAFCLNATSNQKFYAISSASAVSLVGSIMIICIFASKFLKEDITSDLRSIIAILISTVMVLQISLQAILRYESVFWETGMVSQNVLIEDGSNAGLYVTNKRYNEYYTALENLKILDEYDAKSVLFLSKKTWYYLNTDYDISTYSAWIAGVTEHSVKRLEAYYKLNPDKKPDVVYVDKVYEGIANLFCEKMGYKTNRNDASIILVRA